MIRSPGFQIQHFPAPDQSAAVATPKSRQVVVTHRVRMRVLQQTPGGLQPRQNQTRLNPDENKPGGQILNEFLSLLMRKAKTGDLP